ncbi:MAG: dienelactone hydrolase family protein [bacterium]|nr:dienelactone hydrolase family protein [bacterium]
MSSQQPEGFLATPTTTNGTAVLVLHAWWGLNDTMRTFCNRLAKHGFVAFAPDLYHGKLAETIADAESLSSALDADQARIDIREAIHYLLQQTNRPDRGLAVIGFSLGAFFALELSEREPEAIESVVVFYGTRPGDYCGAKANYLGHFAVTDEFEPSTEVHNLESSLRNAGRPVSFYHYPGTGHWFFEPDRIQAYDQPAADLAWERTLSFLLNPANS